METNNNIRAGTACGTLLTVIVNLTSEDVFKTAILAAIGAVASFGVSLLLKQCIRMIKRKP